MPRPTSTRASRRGWTRRSTALTTGLPSTTGSLPPTVRALFLIDGEHYPPVVTTAMESVEESLGARGVAAAFLGGTEKLKGGTDYGVPLVKDKDPVSAVQKALREHEVEVVVDLSDEPVVGYRERMRIASLVLAAGGAEKRGELWFSPPQDHQGPAET